MYELDVIILTKSYKPARRGNGSEQGYCVAGIDTSTGQLVRLVYDRQGDALINDDTLMDNGELAGPMTRVSVKIAYDAPYKLHQENKFIEHGVKWNPGANCS